MAWMPKTGRTCTERTEAWSGLAWLPFPQRYCPANGRWNVLLRQVPARDGWPEGRGSPDCALVLPGDRATKARPEEEEKGRPEAVDTAPGGAWTRVWRREGGPAAAVAAVGTVFGRHWQRPRAARPEKEKET